MRSPKNGWFLSWKIHLSMENPSRNKNDLELPLLPHGNRKYLVVQLTQAHSLWLSPPNSSQVAQKFHDSSNDPKKILGKPPKELTCSYYIPMIFPWLSHDFPMICIQFLVNNDENRPHLEMFIQLHHGLCAQKVVHAVVQVLVYAVVQIGNLGFVDSDNLEWISDCGSHGIPSGNLI